MMDVWTICVILGLCLGSVACQGEWRRGRGTYYGDQPWLWDIHYGSCGKYYIWPDIGTGWDVAALPDVHPNYGDSCGRCYEVKCDPSSFTDNYGNHLDRQGACFDPNWSVVVSITDTCPCHYPDNLHSNKRWCCGDMDHLDLSVWAFEKLSERRWGVIGLQYREVPCEYKPANEAPPAKDPTPGVAPPATAQRPSWATKVITRSQEVGFSSGFHNGWWDKSYSAIGAGSIPGPTGGVAGCADIQPGGALALGMDKGRFSGRVALEAWVQTQNGIPDVAVTVSGPQGSCAPVRLTSLTSSLDLNGFSKFTVYLGLFDKALQKVQAFAADFKGCAGNKAGDIDTIEFKNDKSYPINLCVNDVKLG